MKTLHLSIITIFTICSTVGIGIAYAQYGAGFYPTEHYPPTNDTKLKLIVMNSTEFKIRTTGYNYTLAGIDYNWISKGNNYYAFGGARVTFLVWGFGNATTKGDAFYLDSQSKIKNVFEYDADHPPAGFYTGTRECCLIAELNNTKPPTEKKIESPLQQFKSGIPASDVKCADGLTLVIKSEDGSPACVKSDTVQKLIERSWAKEIVTTNQTFPSQNSNSSRILTNPIAGLGNYTGIINWKNQTYYFETPNYTKTANGYQAQILFHNVLFTLFPGESGGSVLGDCEGMHYMTDTKFPDGTREMLYVFVDTSCSYDDIPIKLSAHTNPQAGLTVYDGKMKLLVNTENK